MYILYMSYGFLKASAGAELMLNCLSAMFLRALLHHPSATGLPLLTRADEPVPEVGLNMTLCCK